jgi:predicted nuclease of predicted toxin-antitoxin system
LSTDLKLLIDEAVPDPLAHAIQRISAVRSLYARDVPEVAGKDDQVVMEFAHRQNRIVFTTERKFKEFPVCTHPGIVILAVRERHESIRQRIFARFMRSGYRKHTKDNLTLLSTDQAEIEDHSGEVKTYRF